MKPMSLDSDVASIHHPPTGSPVVYVSWREDVWQQGDPMFYLIDQLHQAHPDLDRQGPVPPPAENREAAR